MSTKIKVITIKPKKPKALPKHIRVAKAAKSRRAFAHAVTHRGSSKKIVKFLAE